MILSRWKGHLKLLQPVTLFCDALAVAALAGIAFVLTPVSFVTSWVFKFFNIEGPSMLKWGIIGFCAISLGLKYILFNRKGIKESQWVDKKWLKEFQHFTPHQLDHYAKEHFKFHRLMSLVWIGAAILNFTEIGFLIIGAVHLVSTYFWKQRQHATSKMILPHGEVEHFPMEVIGTIEDPMDALSAIEAEVLAKAEEKKLKSASRSSTQSSGHRSSGHLSARHASHPARALKQAMRHKVKHTVKHVEQELKPGH